MYATSSSLLSLKEDVQSCSKCVISRYCQHKVVYRLHNCDNIYKIDLLFVGEAPGESEYVNKTPFIGPAGDCFNAIVAEAVPRDTSYCVTNAVWCIPYIDESRSKYQAPSLAEISNCSYNLKKLIDIVNPKYFVALGTVAAKSLKILNIPNFCKVSHPSAIMQSSKYEYEFDNAVLLIKQYLGN